MSPARTALVADDDPESRRLLVRLLEQDGWRVREASTGKQVLEISERETLDLILLDLRMPGPVDGLRAISLLRQNQALRGLPVIAVSASPYKEYRQRAFAAGCTAFLSKPVNLAELRKRIEQLAPPQEPE